MAITGAAPSAEPDEAIAAGDIAAGCALPGRQPARRCLATGEIKTRDQLIRFVRGAKGEILPDLAEKIPGRGLWVSATATALNFAIRKNLFARAAKAAAHPAPDLLAQTQNLLRARCLQQLGLARRAGAIVRGQPQVEAAAKNNELVALLLASDAGQDGAAKLARFNLPTHQLLHSQELGQALGEPQQVYVGLKRQRLTDSIIENLTKLQGLLASAGQTVRNTSRLEKAEK